MSALSAPLVPSPRPLAPTSAAASALAAPLVASKAPQPPVTIDLTAFHQLQQQFQTQQTRMPALPLSAANSATASVTLSQPLAAWTGGAADGQQNSSLQTLMHSFNRHTGQPAAGFAQPMSFSSPSPPPQIHTLVQQPHNHPMPHASSSSADRPGSELSYSVYYPQSPPASAVHTLSSGFHQPASPLVPNTGYWPIQYDLASGQQQYVLKAMTNGSNILVPAPLAVAQPSTTLVKQEGGALIDASQQALNTPGRHSACAVCHSAKTSCNGQRPCDRCIRLDRQSMCVDRPRKTPVRSDKKKEKKKGEDGEEAEAEKGKKASKREHDNGTDEAGSKRAKGEEGVEAVNAKAEDILKSEVSLLAPPTGSNALSAADTPGSPAIIRRDMSSHSSHTDSASSTTPSSPASALEEVTDFAASTLSSEPERRLSATYLRMHQMYPTRGAIADAIRCGAVTPLQVHFLLSYLSAVLHTDDFKQLLHSAPSPASTPTSLLSSPTRPYTNATLPADLVSERGVYIPRFHFNFGCSLVEPVDDNTEGLIDFATLQIIRVDPADIDPTADSTIKAAAGFGLLDRNGRSKSASPSPPAVPFAASSTSAFTVVPSTTASATTSPITSPNASSLSSSSSSATASSPAPPSSLVSPPSSTTTISTAVADAPSRDVSMSSPSNASSSASGSTSSSEPLPSFTIPSPSPADALMPLPASSPSSSFSASTAPPGTSSQLFLTIRVNREFERLFGYAQPFMRDLFRSEGGKVLYRLLSGPSMPLLSKWLTEALIGERTEFKAVVTIVNRYKGTTECLLNCRWTLDSGGLFRSVAYCFAPLPDKSGGGGRWVKSET